MNGPLYRLHVPPPCPVDDCPFTSCVAPAAPGETTTRQLPARDGVKTPRRRVVLFGTVPGALTTATYRRPRAR